MKADSPQPAQKQPLSKASPCRPGKGISLSDERRQSTIHENEVTYQEELIKVLLRLPIASLTPSLFILLFTRNAAIITGLSGLTGFAASLCISSTADWHSSACHARYRKCRCSQRVFHDNPPFVSGNHDRG